MYSITYPPNPASRTALRHFCSLSYWSVRCCVTQRKAHGSFAEPRRSHGSLSLFVMGISGRIVNEKSPGDTSEGFGDIFG